MVKRVIYSVLLLFIIASSAYAIRLPGKGKFKDITEYIREVQEEDLWNSRDNTANRRASQDKKPWMMDDLWDMETTWTPPAIPIAPPIAPLEWCLIECPPIIYGDDCEDWVT